MTDLRQCGFFCLFCNRSLVQTQQQHCEGIWVIFSVIFGLRSKIIPKFLFYTSWTLRNKFDSYLSNTCGKYSGSKDYLRDISGLFWGGRGPCDVGGGGRAVLSGGFGRGEHLRRHRLVLLPRRFLCGAIGGALYTSHTANCSEHITEQRRIDR